jgi:hypothetical protein
MYYLHMLITLFGSYQMDGIRNDRLNYLNYYHATKEVL